MLSRSLALVALLAASSADAFWRLPCAQPLIVERADPIVNPGGVSGHVHTVSGASNFALSNTFENMRASECTSCLVKQDMSAYWTPQMYFQWANGSFSSVDQVGGGLIYYLPRNHSSDTTKVQAFPDGLRMLIGNPFLRSYSGSAMAQAIGWNCLGAPVTETRQPYLPPYNCPNGLRGELRFPSCWDGKNVDSSDHFSHMAYPTGGESGPCPTTHPVRLVTLFYEMMWSVDPWKGVRSQGLNATQPFVLAMGDASGYGYHGDFLDGWDKTVLQEAIDTCTSDSGVIEYCKVFDLYDEGHTCAKTPDVNEIVLGTLPSLPGCNPVTLGPATATPCSASTTPAVFTNTTAYTGGAPPPGSQILANQPSVVQSFGAYSYQDCYSDLVGGVRALPNGLTTVNKTIEACINACDAKGYTYCGVEYHGECWGSNTLGSQSTALGYGSCDLSCIDNPLQYCGGSNPAAMELYKRTGAAASTTSKAVASTTTSKATTTTSKSTAATSTTTITTTTKAATTTTVSASPSASVSTKLTTSPDWTYSKCALDNINGARSLPYTLTNSAKTISGCLALCKTAGYAVCALSYMGECYGGAALSSASTTLPASSCAMACSGDSTGKTTCGGSNALDVYISKTIAPLTQPTTPNLATYRSWKYQNCYSDLVNNVRSLPLQLTNSNKTIEACLNACTTAGAKVCALSYGSECWYSTTTISSASTVLAASRCGMPCRGNPLEWCGGSAALSVYTLASNPLALVASTTSVRALIASTTTKPAALNNARTAPTTTTKAALRAARTIPAKIKAKRNQVNLRKREF
ncbi:hypothetical protein BCR35DRAFT_292930 [Leucosporidium creatinivorum]|uniref:WSC domain-containing protein n=1 Tax=Leucosporidium creatinivorum TaxID=106004 RepID=A0A1Y2EUQ7_9BASI|nr:hypothetical protein BCR35DRAFT_292930 [Leucosporidium creatinivorum]